MATFHFVSVVVSIPKLWTDMEPFRGAIDVSVTKNRRRGMKNKVFF